MTMPLLIQENISLKQFNTFAINAKAKYFTAIQSLDDVNSLNFNNNFDSLPWFILGGGSNVLFTADFPGLVIKNDIKGIKVISEDNDNVWIQVGAGENWHEFVMYCVERGYGGIENLSLIPGTVGAAPIQNIGAYGVELRDTFHQLEAFDLSEATTRTFTNQECQFGYRDSIFKSDYKNKLAILSVTFKLNKKPIFNLSYGNLKETLDQMQVNDLSLKAVSDAVVRIRQSKLPDPKILGNAGSFFKNPVIPFAQFIELQKTYSQIPSFSMPNSDEVKISAAWLIEQCGWKGKRFGDIGVYDKQALILVNHGGGSGAAIQELAHKIQRSILETFGIELTPEVNFV